MRYQDMKVSFYSLQNNGVVVSWRFVCMKGIWFERT